MQCIAPKHPLKASRTSLMNNLTKGSENMKYAEIWILCIGYFRFKGESRCKQKKKAMFLVSFKMSLETENPE